MKHVKPLGHVKPMPAQDSDVFCRIAVLMVALGIPVPKEFVQKCIGVR